MISLQIKSLFILTFSLSFLVSSGQKYKQMMADPKYTFHEVVNEAERYFETHDKGEGSGYKGYQRWKYHNEDKYGPSGIRNTIDPHFAEKGFVSFKKEFGEIHKTNSSSGWKDLGPYSADSITSGYNPGIGRVIPFYVDPNNEAKIYLGARGGGFWKSLDSGNTWVNTTDFLISSGGSSITASPTNSDSVLIAIRNAQNGTTHGIYRSINGGNTWDSTLFVPSTLGWGGLGTTHKIHNIKISPHDPDLVVIATSNGLYVSVDNIQSWTKRLTGDFEAIAFHPTNPNYIYTVDRLSPSQLIVSNDKGSNFSSAGNLSSNFSPNVYLSTSLADSNSVFAASNDGVWKSTDKGNSFTHLSTPPNSIRCYAVSDVNTSFQTLGFVDNFRSTDGGQNFTQYSWWSLGNPSTTNSNYVHADSRIVQCVNGNFYLGTDGYFCKSTDNCVSWKRLSGYGVREYYRVGVSQGQAHLNMCGSQDNGTSILDTVGWFEWNGGDGMEAVIHPLNENWMIGSWQFGNRNRTKNAGLTRQNVKHTGSPYWDAPMLMDPNDHMKIYSFADEVFRTDDFASNWNMLGKPTHFSNFIRDAAIAENNSQKMALASYNDIALTLDGGSSFTDITNTSTNQYVSDIAFDPNNDNTLIAVYSHHWDYKRVFISTNSGNTWQDITYNLNKIPIHCVIIDKQGNIYLGGELGVYTKTMNASIWSLYNQNLPNVAVKELEIQEATNTLRAATWGRGLW
ncbi:MAG: hypothetical protein N4A46_14695, partial [Schleiferiaceae bacterium]|nr:hypothetical protein [Schleiferiaceae bacterium]